MCKPAWTIEVPPEEYERIDGVGLVLRAPVQIADAPDFVVPRRWSAAVDDPMRFPAVLTLSFWSTPSGLWHDTRITDRVDRTQLLVELDGGVAWEGGNAPYAYTGRFPEIPFPRLRREAVAHVGVPRARPLLSETGRHVDALISALPERRAPRVSPLEEALIRSAYMGELECPGLATEWERRAHVFDLLAYELPDQWPRRDGRSPDYDRLRPYLAELKAERASRTSES